MEAEGETGEGMAGEEATEIEPKYEFTAPKFHDFEVASPGSEANDEQWFNRRNTDFELRDDAMEQENDISNGAVHAADNVPAASSQPHNPAAAAASSSPACQRAESLRDKAKAAGMPLAGRNAKVPRRVEPAGGGIFKKGRKPQLGSSRIATTKRRDALLADSIARAVAADGPLTADAQRDWCTSLRSGRFTQSKSGEDTCGRSKKLTVPESPKLCHGSQRSARSRTKALTSEEAELEAVQRDLDNKKREKRLHARQLRRVQAAGTGRRNEHTTTVPIAFAFETDSRLGSKVNAPKTAADKTAAEQMQNFCSRAPAANSSYSATTGVTRTLTRPLSPAFHATAHRSRTEVQSAAARDAERKLAEQQAHAEYKAKPVNLAVLASRGELGVPRVSPKPVTEPTSFHFATGSRAEAHKQAQPAHEAHRQAMHAMQARAKAQRERKTRAAELGSPPSGDQQGPKAPTVAHSPMLSYKFARSRPVEQPAAIDQFKAKPVNYKALLSAGDLGVPKVEAAPLTEPRPFNLATDARGALAQAALEKQCAQQEAVTAAAHEVKATAISHYNSPVVQHGLEAPKPLTSPHPFNLHSLPLHELKQEQIKRQKCQRMEQEDALHSNFHARPVPKTVASGPSIEEVIARKPAHIPLTEPNSPHIESKRRATDRAAYDAQMKERRQAAEAKRKEEEAEKELAEAADMCAITLRPSPLDLSLHTTVAD